MMGDDSNLDIMPPRKKHKVEKKVNSNKKTVLSKSQKRKLKKLEEDKEKQMLAAKTAQLLDKYKVSEDVSSLLQSSKAIGRSATKLEKRKRTMQFTKAAVDNSDESDDDFDSSLAEPITPEHAQVHIPTLLPFSEPQEEMISPQQAHEEDENMYRTLLTTCRDDNEEGFKRMDEIVENGDVPVQGPAFVVPVSRPPEVEETRKDLPIIMMEQEIMEAINYHPTVIISGQTGCGKTTQVPQFLYEAGFGSKQNSSRSGIIGITQPRRVAVLATAKRVAFELGVRLGKEVGFQVRYDKKIGENSSIKFMTDGILLREIQNDFLLKRYSVIILDEAHERSLNTDILIGMLARVIKIRQELYKEQQSLQSRGTIIPENQTITPLKLILMSATLRVEDFVSGKRLFPNLPPVIEVPTRQYPVTIHFSKKTEIVDYIGQAYKKVMSIHKKLPQGGILVFVTGQREVDHLCEKLHKSSKELIGQAARRDAFVKKVCDDGTFGGVDMKEIAEAFDDGSSNQTYNFSSHEEDPSEFADNNYRDDSDEEDMLESDEESDWETVDDGFASSTVEEGKLNALRTAFNALADRNRSESTEPTKSVAAENQVAEQEKKTSPVKLRVLPLYAMLSPAAQLRVFAEVGEGERLVVVATNVAETSLTIPGIKYVVDTGRVKKKNYDTKTGMEIYEVDWISQASASQRAGRAGRTGPGHCYRLYSSAVFSNIFEESSPPEITKVPIDGVVLLMKSMNIEKVENFPFPTPLEPLAIREAERCLKTLEALDSKGWLTPLGKAMSHYPMSPRHSRMLLTVIQLLKERNKSRPNLVLGYAVAAVAALSFPNPLIMQFDGENKKESQDSDKTVKQEDKQWRKERKEKIKAARDRFSNPSSDALTVAYALHSFEVSENGAGFCESNGLHWKTMDEMSKLKDQLLRIVFSCSKPSETDNDFTWTHGTIQDVEKAWRVTTSSSSKYPLLLNLNEEELLGRAICAGWADRVARKTKATEYQACAVRESVFLHRRSSLINSAPELLVYSELLLSNRPYMHGVTRVKPEWLVEHAKSLCVFSAPLKDPKPYYSSTEDTVFCSVVPSFGPHLWELPAHDVPVTGDKDRAAVFGCALLQGKVLLCLNDVKEYLAGKPETLLEREAWGLERVGSLVIALTEKKIDSLERLRKCWEQNPNALYPEFQAWFQKRFCHKAKEYWQKMLPEAQNIPSERFGKLKRSRK